MIIYNDFQYAFDYYNKVLFNNELPTVVIVLNRNPKVKGYFSPKRYKHIQYNSFTHELALNPQYFENKIELILSTLVHEMCHLKIESIGKTGKNGYHNKAWSNLMLSIGLIPTDNGKPGGKLIGYKMTHYIEENGLFSIKTKELLSNGFCLKWKDADCINLAENTIEKTKVKKGGKRIKYSCGCSSVWGKDNLNIFCGKCQKKFEINEE